MADQEWEMYVANVHPAGGGRQSATLGFLVPHRNPLGGATI
ncbi:hypothetical protein [Nocardia sp. NPDC057668]